MWPDWSLLDGYAKAALLLAAVSVEPGTLVLWARRNDRPSFETEVFTSDAVQAQSPNVASDSEAP